MARLRFRDHREYHLQVLRLMLVMGAAAALGQLDGGSPLVGAVVGALFVPAFGFALVPPRRDHRRGDLLLGAALCAVGGIAGLALAPRPDAPAIAVGLAAGFLAARGVGLTRRVVVSAACGASVALGAFVTTRLAAGPFADLPPLTAALGGGALAGLTAALGAVALHVTLERDGVLEAWAALKDSLEGEVGGIVDQALIAYRRIGTALDALAPEERAPLRKAVNDLTLSILQLARRLVAIDREAHATSTEELAKRLETLDRKIAATDDRVAREQYGLARTAVLAQLTYLKDIGAGRERIIARMHHDLAGLERLRLALVNHRSADVQRVSADVQVILDDLRSLGQEFDLKAEAMGEAQAAIDPPAAPA
jgi:hypothetical protein